MKDCEHNERTRFTDGYYCRDCSKFISKDSAEYRSGELMSGLWMVLHNINAESMQKGLGEIPEAIEMRDKIGIGIKHKNYEDLILEAEAVMYKYKKNHNSAKHILNI